MTETSLSELYLECRNSLDAISESLCHGHSDREVFAAQLHRTREAAATLYAGVGRELERFSRQRHSRRKRGA